MSAVQVDPGRLDDPGAVAAADPGDMLRQAASAAAQVREAQLHAAEAGLDRIAGAGRPRSIVVTGTGASSLAGDVLAAVCGPGCPVPVMTVRGHGLPGWVGADDLVTPVSGSGTSEETLAAAVEAVRRGCRLLCVGPAGSPLADLAVQAGAPFVQVRPVGRPRAALWGLAVPLVLAARALRLADLPAELVESTARVLEDVSHLCRPASESFVNPAKRTAVELAGTLPVVWGTSPLAAAAARRFAGQLAANAKYPALYGELPASAHDQLPVFDGPFAGASGVSGVSGEGDFFRDRVDEVETTRLSLVILRDTDEHPRVAAGREVCADLARDRGAVVVELPARDGHPLERLAGLIAHADYTSIYLALAIGVDPTPVTATQELQARMA